jgi:hypothetical protein
MSISLTGGILSNIITYVRRIIKTPSDQVISDALIGDYINRFWVYDVPERIQLFELARQYTFQTVPNRFEYQAPLVFDANGNSTGIFQYQNFYPPAYCDGIQLGFYLSNLQFYNVFPELVLNQFPLLGDGGPGPYDITVDRSPILRGFTDDLNNLLPYVYASALDATGEQMYVVDNGQGQLLQTDASFQYGPNGPSQAPILLTSSSVNYDTGVITGIQFAQSVPAGEPINIQTSPYSSGFPRIMLFYNNIFKIYPVPDRAYKIQIDAQITPAAFINTADFVPFAYMSEYIARGAARKILSDNADVEQFNFYEPLFREQEDLVLRKTSRQRAVQRTPTIYSSQTTNNPYIYAQY